MEPVSGVVQGTPDTIFKGYPGVEDLPTAVSSEYIISRWHPSEEDKKRIAEGGDIYLWVKSRALFPAYVGTETPIITPEGRGCMA
jgi:hypothetical protein